MKRISAHRNLTLTGRIHLHVFGTVAGTEQTHAGRILGENVGRYACRMRRSNVVQVQGSKEKCGERDANGQKRHCRRIQTNECETVFANFVPWYATEFDHDEAKYSGQQQLRTHEQII